MKWLSSVHKYCRGLKSKCQGIKSLVKETPPIESETGVNYYFGCLQMYELNFNSKFITQNM